MTLIEKARQGQLTEVMKQVADSEGLEVEVIRAGLAAGTIVIPANKHHRQLRPRGIGAGLSTKINANIGTSEDYCLIETELKKLGVAVKNGADAVMDLSTGEQIKETRREIIKNSTVAVGTVPIYQATVEILQSGRAIVDMTRDDLFNTIIEQAEDGVDFITVHCGLLRAGLEHLKKEGRVSGLVSRGGSFLAGWMGYNQRENPLYQHYDYLLEIAREYELTLSLGDGLRPGCLADATDRGQIHELLVLGELVERARAAGVQTMVEGPGHLPFNQITTNISLAKELCKGAPFYVLGPLVSDITPGYDHITAAIGGTLAATAGADFLCYVTPAEHLGLPTVEDVKEGVIAAKIAAHAADLATGNQRAIDRDRAMARARKNLDWEQQFNLAIDPEKARRFRREHNPRERDVCTMCGQYCALKIAETITDDDY